MSTPPLYEFSVERKRKDHLMSLKENLTNTVPENGLPAAMHGLNSSYATPTACKCHQDKHH
jgi:hypothetical protein